MKICYIFSNFHLVDITGQPAIILKLARFAAKSGHEVYLISNTAGKKRIDQDGISVLLLKGSASPGTYLLNLGGIIRYLKAVKPEVIFVHGHRLITFVWPLTRLLKIPLACSVCEVLDEKVVGPLYKRLIIFCLTRARIIFTTSEYLKKELRREGIPAEKIRVARVGLDERFLHQEHDGAVADTDVLYYGDSTRERGFDIISRLSEQMPQFKFKVLLRWKGEDCRTELEKMRKLPNVIIRHYPYSESLEEIISRSKLVVLPYRWMSMRPPLSLLEPMALGRCVLTSNLQGNDEVIKDRVNGLMFDFEGNGNVASEISLLLKDEKQREDIGRQAKATVKEIYSADEYKKILIFCAACR